MGEPRIENRELSSLGDWERWLADKVTREFFDTVNARIVIIRDELEVADENVKYKQGEVANLRFILTLPEVIVSDLKQKEKEDARRTAAERG